MQFLYDHLVAFALALFAALAFCLFARLLKKRIARLATELHHRLRPTSLAVFLTFATLEVTPVAGLGPLRKHSDMKDVAYYYVYKLYEGLVTKGGLK